MKFSKRAFSFLLSVCLLGTSLPAFPAQAIESVSSGILNTTEEPRVSTDIFELADFSVSADSRTVTVSLTASADSTLILALYDESAMFDSVHIPITGSEDEQSIDAVIDPAGHSSFTIKAFLLDPKTYACLCKKTETHITQIDVKDIAAPADGSIKYSEERGFYYVSDTLVVIFEPDVTLFEINTLADALGGEVIGLDDIVKMYQFRVPMNTLDGLQALADEAMEFDFVTYATFDIVTPGAACAVSAVVPNDTWNHDSDTYDWIDADVDGSNWWIEAIDAQYAWSYNDQMEHILLGVVDRSFDQGHEELKKKAKFADQLMAERNDTTPWDKDDDPGTTDIGDQINTHGTHVAGIITAEANNKKGITGLVWDSTVALAPAPELSHTQILSGVSHLVDAGAKVVNMSLGMSGSRTKEIPSFSDEDLQYLGTFSAIHMARLLDEVGDFVLVQASGNGDADEDPIDTVHNGYFCSITEDCYTASQKTSIQDVIDRVIVVGAAEQEGTGYRCCDFSNYGERVDICAPGRSIMSTIPGDPDNLQLWGGYGMSNGTSMAAPIVAGVCGMVWALRPDLDGDEVKMLVCNFTNKAVAPHPESGSNMSYHMVNAQLAVEAALAYKEGKIPVTVVLKDESGKPVSNAAITISGIPTYTGESITTRFDGTAMLFLEKGIYYLSASTDAYYAAQRLDLTEKTEVKLTAKKRFFTWELDEAGTHLTVNGYGPMPQYSTMAWWPKTITSAEIHGVDSISYSAFSSSSALTEVTLDDSIVFIENGAFSYCEKLTKIDLPDELFSLGAAAFNNCDSLSEVTIPGKTIMIGASTFYDCDGLITATLENGISTIPAKMFSACTALSTVSIPSSVISIDYHAFSSTGLTFTGLSSISLCTNLATLGNDVFTDCTSLTSVTLPDSVTTVGSSLFSGCTALNSVTLSNRLTEIPTAMFENCSNLTSIRIPDSVTSIGTKAFYKSGLTSVTVPGSVKTIGDEVWRYCKSLNSVTLQNGVASIGKLAFGGCTGLTTASLPGTLTTIGDSLFGGCSELASATLGTGATMIGNSMFSNCKKLYSFTIPSTVTSIGSSAFYNCKILPSIPLPNGLELIGSEAFKDCDTITSISLPSSITALNSGIFSGCDALQSVSLPSGLTAISAQAFYGCRVLQSISLPASVNLIGSKAFYNCDELTHVTIPSGIGTLESSLFYSCEKLVSVTIPSSISRIGTNVFDGCKALTDIYFGGTSTQWEDISVNVKLSDKTTVHFSS